MSSINELMTALGVSRKTALEIDKGMWDILIELNKKGYKTVCCCEGHPQKEGRWNAYLFFARGRVPEIMPPLYEISKRQIIRKYSQYKSNIFYWYGSNSKKLTLEQKEEERQQLLGDLLEWAKGLNYITQTV